MGELSKSEYESLYREIQDHGTRINQILAFCVGGSTALLSFSFTVDPKKTFYDILLTPFLLLLPFCIIAPSLLLTQASMHTVVRLASYIHHRYENSDVDIRWQQSIQRYRTKINSDQSNLAHYWLRRQFDWQHRPFRLALVSVFGCLGIASLSASLVAFTYTRSHLFTTVKLYAYHSVYLFLVIVLSLLLCMALRSLWNGWGCSSFDKELKLWQDLDFQNSFSKCK